MTWYNYTPLAPLIEWYRDDGSRDLLFRECTIDGTTYRVAVVGEIHAPEIIRVETVDSDGNLTPEQGRIVGQLIDHVITVLRLTTPLHIEKLWFGRDTISFGSHGDAAGKPHFGVSISEHFAHLRPDWTNTAAVFDRTYNERAFFKLLADVAQPNLPLQYRFLSLYKVIEHEFREGKKWPRLQNFVSPWEAEFRALGVSGQSLPNFLHSLRDKCAHIKVGNELGITGLSTADADLVGAVMPILEKVVVSQLAEQYPSLRFEAHSASSGLQRIPQPGVGSDA
ncbi:hypothetical protein FXB41_07025 [Bradyrhizobium canariense]|uniref:hypothetical protein n=1 Tax=Bradyrhizobium canariense TaxID=255045 RepID=UPI001CA49DC6|nr:hypothetical protein [Bradyrhizobium canariense]MBW5434537.1 hypothetical protein [Bradyrhizobium canariense]